MDGWIEPIELVGPWPDTEYSEEKKNHFYLSNYRRCLRVGVLFDVRLCIGTL